MKVFDIRPYRDYGIYFKLAVCPSRKSMAAAIKEFDKKEKTAGSLPAGCLGAFIPSAEIERGGRDYSSNYLGTVFLNTDDADEYVAAHECAHAAFYYMHSVRRYTGAFDEAGIEAQEEFCHFLGAAVEKVNDVIRKNFKLKRGKP